MRKMQDPKPENIVGRKQHTVEWKVDLGQVMLGLVALLVVLKLSQWFADDEDDELRQN